MEFEWDPNKARRNLTKHGISFSEAATVFGTTMRIISMKKPQAKKPVDELRKEYDMAALKGGVRGKYTKRYQASTNLALLTPEVRAAFPTDGAVNRALRQLMKK